MISSKEDSLAELLLVRAAAIDPVCGMHVDTSAGKPHHAHAVAKFHFCSQRCHDKFVPDPDDYLQGLHQAAATEAPEGMLFTCAMHPQISQQGAGVARFAAWPWSQPL